jgi:hypothetical protein
VKLDTLLVRASAALSVIAVVIWLLPRELRTPALMPGQVASGIERYSWAYLASPYPTGHCETAEHLSFAREPGASISDHWYVSSQMIADTALARVAEGRSDQLACSVTRSFRYLEQLWIGDPAGGYAPRSDLDGRNPTTRDVYADDNALAGIAMLDAADFVSDGALRERMTLGAVRAARFLTDGGLWDDRFGGGFWWNTQRELSEGGKPVQTAGLAIQLFARLYERTGDPAYRSWAERALAWCDQWLYEPDVGLYRYGFRDARSDIPEEPTFVSYDQAIMIDAHLAMLRLGDTRLDHLARAQSLARHLESFRSPLGGYVFELGVPQVIAAYSAWTASGLLDLFAVDGRAAWFESARESLRDLNTVLLDPVDGGVYYAAYECIPRWLSVCSTGASSATDERKVHLSQSWTQRALALLEHAERGHQSQP